MLGACALAPAAHAGGDIYVGAQFYGARHASDGDNDFGGGLTVGVGLNDYFGVEASYKKTHLDGVDAPDGAEGVHGAELALRGSHGINDWLGVTAKVGAYHWRGGSDAADTRDGGTDAVVGVGLMFHVSDHLSLSTEYEKILGFDAAAEDHQVALGLRVDFD